MIVQSLWAKNALNWALLVAGMVVLPGCGSDYPRCVPVSGTVTLDGGKVPDKGMVYFTPLPTGKGGITRPGTAEFKADGSYRVKTFVDNDGLLPGRYAVHVECWKTAPKMGGKGNSTYTPGVSHVATKYLNAARSGLTLTVEPDGKPMTFDLKLTSK